MDKLNSKGNKRCTSCFTRVQPYDPETLIPGLRGVKLLDTSEENLKKARENRDRYKLKLMPMTLGDGAVIIGSSTFLNKYSQLGSMINHIEGGPYFMDTRDNKVEIHNGKQGAKTRFSYTYAGGTGELLEFTAKTKFTQSIEAARNSSIDPDTKSVDTELLQCVPTQDDPCKPDAWINYIPGLLRQPVDALRMAKTVRSISPISNKPSPIYDPNFDTITYDSVKDAQEKIANNPSLTMEEIRAYNLKMEEEWNKYLTELSKYEQALANRLAAGDNFEGSNEQDIKYPLPPFISSYMPITRKIRVKVDPVDYSPYYPYPSRIYWGTPVMCNIDHWKYGYKALQASKEITIVYPKDREYKAGRNLEGNEGKGGDLVTVEMEIEIQVPGVRVVSDQRFSTMGEFLSSDLIESVNSQIKSTAKFVGNPDMMSSQIVEIKNVGNRFSGDWYAKEVNHTFDSNGYFTEVTFQKKSRNSVLNRISTTTNTQGVFKKSHDIAEESYTKDTWKIPSAIIQEVSKVHEEGWVDESDGGRQVGHETVARQLENPYKFHVVQSDRDFRVDQNLKR